MKTPLPVSLNCSIFSSSSKLSDFLSSSDSDRLASPCNTCIHDNNDISVLASHFVLTLTSRGNFFFNQHPDHEQIKSLQRYTGYTWLKDKGLIVTGKFPFLFIFFKGFTMLNYRKFAGNEKDFCLL